MSTPRQVDLSSSVERQTGFSLFELVVVIILVGILAVVGLSQYQNEIAGSQSRVAAFQAGAFSRAIENVRGLAVVQKSSKVELEPGLFIYLNNRGWPISSSIVPLVNIKQATQPGCESLWDGLFRTVAADSENERTPAKKKFDVSLIDNYICRYTLDRKQEGSFFFDYDVITGKVVITERTDSP